MKGKEENSPGGFLFRTLVESVCLKQEFFLLDSYFAAEIIGNMLDVEPRRWRRPKRMDFRFNKERVTEFKKMYDGFDWTHLIGK